MQTTISGYPRIGKNRELKFAVEKYWKGALSSAELSAAADALLRDAALTQKNAQITQVPCGDFSLYDAMLDAAVLFGIVPAAYKRLRLSPLDTYFALARGYKGTGGDVKALTMKKWFNTNYHYLVPEFDRTTSVALDSVPFFAKTAEITAVFGTAGSRPALVGPYTLLGCSRFTDCTPRDFVRPLAAAYKALIGACAARGFPWIQLDEPALVRDLSTDDRNLFRSLYEAILEDVDPRCRVLLQTHFGDVRDCYQDIIALPFGAVGLDFIEGAENLSLIAQHGFPAGTVLVAGVVNGKNIWKNDYAASLKILDALWSSARIGSDRIWVSTSCPLLHVPYSLAAETALDAAVKERFAFAEEKLAELTDIARLAELPPALREADAAYVRNGKVKGTQVQRNAAVRRQIESLSERDFTRNSLRAERRPLQHAALKLPLLPTTTIGSFPQTQEIKRNRALLRKGELSAEQYERNIRGFIRDCIRLQESIGLDVLVHGEFERNDMVEYFGENLEGFIFTQNGWVQSYGTRCVKPPVVFGDVARIKPLTVPYSAYAASLTSKPVKGMLTGPVTVLNWSFPREDVSLLESAFQIALAVRAEVLDLETAGIRIIQIDEAALREKLPLRAGNPRAQYLDWAVKAFRLCCSGVKDETQIHTHMCYSEFEDIIAEIDAMDADVITFEASRSKLHILDSLEAHRFETETGPGIYDIHSPRVPAVEEMIASLETMRKKIPAEKLWVNPDCGLKTRAPEETELSLKNMVAAAEAVRTRIIKGEAL